MCLVSYRQKTISIPLVAVVNDRLPTFLTCDIDSVTKLMLREFFVSNNDAVGNAQVSAQFPCA